jgi:hypothetical protein
MRKVQHELQDVMGEHAGLHVHGHFSVHLTSVGLSLSNCCSPLMAKSPPSVSVPIIPSPRHDLGHSISGGSSTFLSSLSLSAEQAALSHSSAGAHASSPEQSHTEESAAATVSSSPGNAGAGSGSSAAHKSPRHPLMTHFSHLSDHDLSSTDDEHDHLTGTNSHASSQSRDNSFSQLLTEAATTPRAGASSSSAATSGLVTSGPPEHSTPSDPTIIDPSQDAAVNQLSYELCEAAHQCAQHLKVRSLSRCALSNCVFCSSRALRHGEVTDKAVVVSWVLFACTHSRGLCILRAGSNGRGGRGSGQVDAGALPSQHGQPHRPAGTAQLHSTYGTQYSTLRTLFPICSWAPRCRRKNSSA